MNGSAHPYGSTSREMAAAGVQPSATCFSAASRSSSARLFFSAAVLSWPQAASMSRPRGVRTGALMPASKTISEKRRTRSGVVPMMARAGEEIGVNLAVSLHAVTKEVRDEIVPINRKYGIEELLQACADYPGANNARRITFEYVMLKDKNDSDTDARELVRLIKHYDLPAKVNLIPFNPWPGAPYECSTPERIRRFSDIIFEAGISAPVRTPRGRDIDAACGQLKTAAEKKSRAELDRLAAEKQAALG